MPHNGADEEAIVGGLGARLHFGCPQVEVHLVVGTGDGCQVEVAHAAQLQLEGQRRLQVPIDAVLCKLVQCGVREPYKQTSLHPGWGTTLPHPWL